MERRKAMDALIKEKLYRAGIETDSAIERFMGNEALYERFALGFTEDRNYETLLKAMEAGDTKTAFTAAHTLKGVCGNLSFTGLLRAVADIVEPLRAGKLETAKAVLPQLTEQYEKTTEALKERKG